MSRREIKTLAKQRFKEQWGTLLLVLLLTIPAEGIALFLGFGVGSVIVCGPLIFGLYSAFLKAAHGEKAEWTDLFNGFRFRFGESFFALIFPGIIMLVIVVFIWAVMMIIIGLFNGMASAFSDDMSYGSAIKGNLFLFFLGGCIVSIAVIVVTLFYSLAFIILHKEPETGALEALKMSRLMVYGDKVSLFIFILTFIGWFLLCFITWGIAFVYVGPYYWMALTIYLEQIYEEKAGIAMKEDVDAQKLKALKEKVQYKAETVAVKAMDKAESLRGDKDENVKPAAEETAEEAVDTAVDEAAEDNPAENVCIYCGAKLPEGAKFCGKCGKQQ